MNGRDIPNLITLCRILLVAPLAWALLEERFLLALTLFVLASGTDAVDGFLARRYGWHTRLGALLDPAADKLLLLASYLSLGLLGFLPAWLVAAVIGRDLLIVVGALAYRLLFGRLTIEPTLLSKLNTLLQIVLVLVALAARGLSWLPEGSVDLLVFAVLATTLLSGLHYVTVWGRRAWREAGRE